MTKNSTRRRSILASMALLPLSACVTLAHQYTTAPPPTLIIYGGTVLSMDKKRSAFNAIAITDDKISALGSEKEMLALRGPKTEVVQIKHHEVVMPGFVEPHTHPDLLRLTGLEPFVYNISPIDAYAAKAMDSKSGTAIYNGQLDYQRDLLPKIKIAISNADESNGLVIFGWDPIFYGGTRCSTTPCPGNLPWLDDPGLDDGRVHPEPKVAINNAFFGPGKKPLPLAILLQSMHTIYTNQAWIERYGLEAACEKLGPGKKFCFRDKAGQLIGRFEEADGIRAAMGDYFIRQAEKHPFEFRRASARSQERAISAYHRAGITTVGVLGTDSEEMHRLSRAGRGKLRMGFFVKGNVQTDSPEAHLVDAPLDHAWARNTGTKLWYDGSPYTGSMFMNGDDGQYYLTTWLPQQLGIPMYTTPPYKTNNNGHQTYCDKEFRCALDNALDKGMVAVHVQGSHAGTNTLEMYDESKCKTANDKVRCRLEHNGFLGPDEMKMAFRKGVHLSFHVLHIYWYGADLGDIVNGAALKNVMMIQSAIDAGNKVSFHTDSPMYPPNPMLTVRTAVTRRTFKTDSPMPRDPSTGIDIDHALAAITINAAQALNFDDMVGSLEVGKKADVVVLPANPYKVLHERIDQLQVSKLYVDGKLVYSN